MKKPIILLLAASLLTTAAPAQAWKEALKKAATAAADKAADGKLTQYALTGTWNYTGPGVKFEGADLTSELAGTAIESAVTPKLEQAYALAGIRPGACAFTFGSDGTFSARTGKHDLTGTYEYDASTHALTLRFAQGKLNLGTVPGHAYLSGSELAVVFPVTRLVELATRLGSRISSLSSATKLLEQYKDIYIGFAFEK